MKSTSIENHHVRAGTVMYSSCIGLGVMVPAGVASAQIDFSDPIWYPAFGDVIRIESAHLNRDELIDVVTLHEFGEVTIYLNQGSGSFELGTILGHPGVEGMSLAVVDIDGNRINDIVWIDDSRAYVFRNDGTGRNGTVDSLDVGSAPRRIAFGDLDADGDSDAVVGERYQATVYRNEGNGGFSLIDTVPLPPDHNDPEDIEIGDVDNDGDLDAVVLSADGQFNYYGEYKAWDTQITFMFNDGTGQISQTRRTPLPYDYTTDYTFPQDFALADLNGNGSPDIALALGTSPHISGNTGFAILENSGRGIFTGPVTEFEIDNSARDRVSVRIADLDADGDLELVGFSERSHVSVAERIGPDYEFQVRTYALDDSSAGLAVGDYDNDGRWDIVGGGSVSLAFFLNETLLTGPSLEVSELQRGQPARFQVDGANPSELVYFLADLQGVLEPTLGIGALGGLTLDLGHEVRLLAASEADQNGTAVLELNLSNRAPRGRYSFQAVVRRGSGGSESQKTNFALRALTQ